MTLSLSPTSPSTLLSFSSFPLSSCTSYCFSPSSSLMSWTETTRTAVEELGPPDFQNSSTGYEPNDHFITEACVEYTQESSSEQRFPEDFDYDDITIGQTLLDACRRRADHSEEEGLSSCLSSLFAVTQVTRKVTKFRGKTLEANRLGLFWTDKWSKSSLIPKRRLENTNSRLIMTEEVFKT